MVTKKTKKGDQQIDLKEKMTVLHTDKKPGEMVLSGPSGRQAVR